MAGRAESTIGLDLGQVRDPSAIAVLERLELPGEWDPVAVGDGGAVARRLREMAEVRVKISAEGNEQLGAWREGEHDDLVFAVALACWGTKKMYPGPVGGGQGYLRLPGI